MVASTGNIIVGLWLLCVVIVGYFAYKYFKCQKEGFDVVSDYQDNLKATMYAAVEAPEIMLVANGDPQMAANPYDAQVFSDDFSKTIKVYVPARCPIDAAKPAAPSLDKCLPNPPAGAIQVTVGELLNWDAFERRFKSLIDSAYKGDRDEARRDIFREARAILFQPVPISLAAYALGKYSGDIEAARQAVLTNRAALEKEQKEIGEVTRIAVQRVALGEDPATTPSSQKFSTRLASYVLAKYNGQIFEARQAILSDSEKLRKERVEIDFNSIISQQDVSGVNQLLGAVMYPGVKDPIQTVFPKTLSAYALAVKEMEPVEARKALFSNYNGLQAAMQTDMYPPEERAAWDRNPRAKVCERIDNLVTYFNNQKDLVGKSMRDVSGAGLAMIASKRENKKFQYAFETLCTPLMKRDPGGMSPKEKSTYENCRRMASVDPILYPMIRYLDTTFSALVTAEVELTENKILDTFNEVRALVGCGKSGSPAPAPLQFKSGYDDSPSDFDMIGTLSYSVTMALSELSPYYISPEVLDFVTKYVLQATELDEAAARINDYLSTTDQNRVTTYAIVTDLINKRKA